MVLKSRLTFNSYELTSNYSNVDKQRCGGQFSLILLATIDMRLLAEQCIPVQTSTQQCSVLKLNSNVETIIQNIFNSDS